MSSSVQSTIEAQSRFKRKQGFLGEVFSPELQLRLGSANLSYEQQAELVLEHIPQHPLEYDEVVDAKIMFLIISENIDVSDMDSNPEEYTAVRQLYKRVF